MAAITKSLTDTFTAGRLVDALPQREAAHPPPARRSGRSAARWPWTRSGPPRDRPAHRRMRHERYPGGVVRPPAAVTTGKQDARSRTGIVLRPVAARRSPRGRGPDGVTAAATAGGAGAAGPVARKRSRSRRTIRPCGPVPVRSARSMSRSRRACARAWLAKTRPPPRAGCPFVPGEAGPAAASPRERCRSAAADARAVAGTRARPVLPGPGKWHPRHRGPRRCRPRSRLSPGDEHGDQVPDLAGVAFAEDKLRPMTPPSSAAYSTSGLLRLDLRDWRSRRRTVSPGDTSQCAIAVLGGTPASTDGIRTTVAIELGRLPRIRRAPVRGSIGDFLGPRDRGPLKHPGDRGDGLGAVHPLDPGWSSQSKNRRCTSSYEPPAVGSARAPPARRPAPRWSS